MKSADVMKQVKICYRFRMRVYILERYQTPVFEGSLGKRAVENSSVLSIWRRGVGFRNTFVLASSKKAPSTKTPWAGRRSERDAVHKLGTIEPSKT